MKTSIQDLPGEVFKEIISNIDPIDYLKVTLVSRHFCKWARDAFKWEEMTKAEVIQGQISFEACLDLHRGQHLAFLICTHCGLVKTSNQFSDNQTVPKVKRTRFCISCGISERTYTKGKRPTVNGESHIPCWLCRMAVPMSRDWQERLTSGKNEMTRILQQSQSEGQLLKYKTIDGRLLTWAEEPETLAFCMPCLRSMKRDGTPGRITNLCD